MWNAYHEVASGSVEAVLSCSVQVEIRVELSSEYQLVWMWSDCSSCEASPKAIVRSNRLSENNCQELK